MCLARSPGGRKGSLVEGGLWKNYFLVSTVLLKNIPRIHASSHNLKAYNNADANSKILLNETITSKLKGMGEPRNCLSTQWTKTLPLWRYSTQALLIFPELFTVSWFAIQRLLRQNMRRMRAAQPPLIHGRPQNTILIRAHQLYQLYRHKFKENRRTREESDP